MLHPEPRSYFFVRCAQSSAHAGLARTEEGRLSFLTAYSWALHVVHRLRCSPYLWNLLNDVVEAGLSNDGPVVQGPGHACRPFLGGDVSTDAVGELVRISFS